MSRTDEVLRIVADENIAAVEMVFSAFGDVRVLPASQITPDAVRDADVLLVRSVTRVSESLLQGSHVRFVGSATIGTDHIDLPYLRQAGIRFAHAPGSNAGSVVEYVVAALVELAAARVRPLHTMTAAIVGCGNIGGQLALRLESLGVRVRRNDPPLQRAAERIGRSHRFESLEAAVSEADIVSLHVPLTRSGRDRTFHLFDRARLDSLRRGCTFINTSRGSVVDSKALANRTASGAIDGLVLDVWEGEPLPGLSLVVAADISTAHIAGYSYDGKLAGTEMLRAALCDQLDLPDLGPDPAEEWEATWRLEAPADDLLDEISYFQALVRQIYPILRDSEVLKATCTLSDAMRAEAFSAIRRDYPARYAFERFEVAGVPERLVAPVRDGLRIGVVADSDQES